MGWCVVLVLDKVSVSVMCEFLCAVAYIRTAVVVGVDGSDLIFAFEACLCRGCFYIMMDVTSYHKESYRRSMAMVGSPSMRLFSSLITCSSGGDQRIFHI